MRYLWTHDGSATTAQVHAEVGEELAYTTVMTILTRLWKKSQVERDRVFGAGKSAVHTDAAAQLQGIRHARTEDAIDPLGDPHLTRPARFGGRVDGRLELFVGRGAAAMFSVPGENEGVSRAGRSMPFGARSEEAG